MAREIGAIAPVLAAAEEEHLDRGVAARLMRGDDVGIAQALTLMSWRPCTWVSARMRSRMQRGAFEIERVRALLHALAQLAAGFPGCGR